MRNRRSLIVATLLVCFIVIIVIVNNIRNSYSSPEAVAKRFADSVSKKDFATAKKICPTYSDDSKISEEAYELLFNELSEKTDDKLLLDKSNFRMVTTNGLVPKTFFLPEKRYISVTTANSNEQISAFQKNREVQLKDNKIGPLISYQYTFEFEIDNPVLGTITKKEKVSLKKDRDITLTDNSTFLESTSLQKQFVGVVSDFYLSYNESIRNNFDFASLSSIDNETKNELSETMSALKPFIETYSQSFQTIIMNATSLKLDSDLQTVHFDVYIDRMISVKLKKEWSDSSDAIQDDSKNAKVTLSYDVNSKKWGVSEIDYETYDQDPANWKKKQQVKLDHRNEATWNENTSGNAI